MTEKTTKILKLNKTLNRTDKILKLNKTLDKPEIKKFINWFMRNYGSIRTVKALEELKILGFIGARQSGASIGLEDLKIPPQKRNSVLHVKKKLEKYEKEIRSGKGNYVLKASIEKDLWKKMNAKMESEVKKNFKEAGILSPIYMMVFSGARGNFSQVKQLVGMRGFFTNSQGIVQEFPIKSSLTEGLTISEYFTSCYGARKGIIDTALKTADAGYLTRRLVYAAQSQIIKKTNCFSKTTQLVVIEKQTKEKYNLTEKKLIGRVIGKDIREIKTKKIIASKEQDICNYLIKKIMRVEKVYIRTPFNCKLSQGLCQLCYGWDLSTGHIVELGESVGVVAAQSIGEPGTQLTMRTFHTGGVFNAKQIISKGSEIFFRSPITGTVNYNFKNARKLRTQYGEDFLFTLAEKNLTITSERGAKLRVKLPKYLMLFVKPNQKVFARQIIGQPETAKIKEEPARIKKKSCLKKELVMFPKRGLVEFEKQTKIRRKKNNNVQFWIRKGNITSYKLFLDYLNNSQTNKIVLNFNFNSKKTKIRNKKPKDFPWIKINYKTFTKLQRFNKYYKNLVNSEQEYMIIKNSRETKEILTKDNYQRWIEVNNKNIKVEKKLGEIIFKNNILYDNYKTPYTCQIIQVRKNKICIEGRKLHSIDNKYKTRLTENKLIPHDIQVGFQDKEKKDIIEKAEDIVQGLPKIEELLEARKSSKFGNLQENPNEILRKEFIKLSEKYTNETAVKKAFEKVQSIIVNRIQTIYQSQQVNIADKHLELIVKQMTSKAMILETGNSNFITGEILEVNKIEKINKKLKNKIKYEPILIGISKISLSNPSFLSQASFQETTRILARSAIEGKIDWLYGLKENLILGNLIPIGTGHKNIKNI
uniref:RNA polymerase subunit beta' n=1 Tax=Colacium mucronatum TaxID=167756 RepID=UPI0023AB3A35|nr:RNA polymerase subunit beta' [Colacium mucronatum]WCH63225.1 RNA polymerase subunit beta' [Colacium mucronatum]